MKKIDNSKKIRYKEQDKIESTAKLKKSLSLRDIDNLKQLNK